MKSAGKSVSDKRKGLKLGIWLAVCVSLTACAGSREKYELRETAIQQMENGDYAGAIETFGQALEHSDGFVGEFELDVLKYRAEAEYETGDYAAAARTYDVLRQTDGEKPEYLSRLGMMYALSGQTDEAVQAFQWLVEAAPEDPAADQILLLAGQQLREAGRGQEAAALFADALDKGRKTGVIYNQLAVSEIEAGDYDLALDYIRQGLELRDEARKDLLYNQAAACEGKLDFAGALQALDTYVQEFGTEPDVEKEIVFLRTRTD